MKFTLTKNRHLSMTQMEMGSPASEGYTFDNGTMLKCKSEEDIKAYMLTKKPADIHTWHHRLAHCDIKIILQMKDLVDGLNITDTNMKGKCIDCIKGKSTAVPHKRPIANIEDFTEGLICTDLWGPSPIRSKGGAYYMMPIIDAEHCVKEVYFTPNKESLMTLSAFDKFHNLLENQTGKRVKRVQFDNKFNLSKEWQDYCTENRIFIEPTPPYSSQSNRITERAIGITTADMCTLLIESGLPKHYRAEAVAYSDLIPSKAIPGKIQISSWTNRKVDVSHLGAFSCQAFVKIPTDANRCQIDGGSKLDSQTMEGVFIGYLPSHGWHSRHKVLLPDGKIIWSKDVEFIEEPSHRTVCADEIENEEEQIGKPTKPLRSVPLNNNATGNQNIILHMMIYHINQTSPTYLTIGNLHT